MKLIYIDKNIDITGTLHVTHNLNLDSNLSKDFFKTVPGINLINTIPSSD